MKAYINLFALLSALFFGLSSSVYSEKGRFSPIVDAKGNIKFPKNFRKNMVHLGSWFVPEGDASGFHGVYTEKKNVDYFKKHGKFPDGATLVKELRASKSGNYTTGKGVLHETGTIKQWFVMVKDGKNRFPENNSWGHGWGWALFKADNTSINASANYQTDCLGCHLPAVESDHVYTEAFPMLNE